MSNLRKKLRTASVLLVVIALTGCERRGPVRDTARPAAAVKQDTVRNASELKQSDTLAVPRLAILRAVRVAKRGEAERVVFEFSGPLPSYRVAYAGLPAEQCGSGQAVAISGDTAIAVSFTAAQAHEQAGERVKVSVNTRDVVYNGSNVKQLKQICDFEGMVEWVIGLAQRTSFEVQELSAPPRLVIDIRKTL